MGNQLEELRNRYRPKKVRVLLIGESPPAGGTFFYRANSNLFYATREAFVAAFGPMPHGTAFLRELQERGIWLVDLAPAPVNRLRGRPRREAVEGRVAELVQTLRKANPEAIVAVKRDLEPGVRTAMTKANLSLDRFTSLPFPLYQWRSEFVHRLVGILRNLERIG